MPSARSCTATLTSPNASRLSGEAITTSGSGPSGRAASSTQSTILLPRIGCRCLGTAERMRVPSPPAITTAANVESVTGLCEMAGAPGFEPGIAGPKPAALPLGYAPVNLSDLNPTGGRAGERQARRSRRSRVRRRRTPSGRARAPARGQQRAARRQGSTFPPGSPRGAPRARDTRRATTATTASRPTTHQSILPTRTSTPSTSATMSAILRRFSRSARPNRLPPCSIVSGRSMGQRYRLAVPDRNGQPGAGGAPESPSRRTRGTPVMEEPVDGRACSADVGAEGAEPEELSSEGR